MAFHDELANQCNRAGVPELYQGFLGAAAKAHDTPGMFFLEGIDSSGNKEVMYFWLDGDGSIRYSTSIPSNQDTAGQIFANASGQTQIKKLDWTTGGTGEQTGNWTMPNPCIVKDVWIKVTLADAGETIDVGTNGAGSNDPDGFLDGISVGALGLVKGSMVHAVKTRGALLVEDEDGAGALVPGNALISGVADLTWTFNAGANTSTGSIYVEYIDLS